MNLCAVLILLSLVLMSCGRGDPGPVPLAGTRIGGPFALVDQDGRPRTERDFAGKYRIMYFGYTFCPDVCPVDMAHIAAGYRAFADRDPVRASRTVPIFVSVDPARDTPKVLKAFTAAFGPQVVGLTGTPDAIAATARAYGIAYSVQKEPGASDYLVGHSRVTYLMDPDNKPIALLSQDEKPAVIAGELDKWVR